MGAVEKMKVFTSLAGLVMHLEYSKINFADLNSPYLYNSSFIHLSRKAEGNGPMTP
jgi:hypothetical protein